MDSSDFYVTLPSNSSMNYFPENTPSSYRTKLSSPLMLNDSWEVGLSEIFIPRNWFNISDHNNEYTLSFEKEHTRVIDHKSYMIEFDISPNKNIDNLCLELNEKIRDVLEDADAARFIPDLNRQNVTIAIRDGIEIHFDKDQTSELLFMLQYDNEDTALTKTVTRQILPPRNVKHELFVIEDKTPLSEKNYVIPFTPIKPEKHVRYNKQSRKDFFSALSKNIEDLDIKKYVTFDYEPIAGELEIRVSDYAELHITKSEAQSFLRIIGEENDVVIKTLQAFKINPLLQVVQGESLNLIVKEYPVIKRRKNVRQRVRLNTGIYKTANELFSQFREIRMHQLPDLKVALHVPEGYEVTFVKELADMLGFVETDFKSGQYTSAYPLELDAGMSEILIYTDIIESHHVGDSYVPLLRIIPCSNEKQEQIVKHYEKPIYFPLKKHFIDTIQIQLRSTSGNSIIFSSGKVHCLLSFRRKNL